MNLGTILAVVSFYIMAWMVCLFIVLPFGVHNQADEGEHIMGTERGAPVVLRMGKKLVATSILAAIAVGLLMWGVSNPTLRHYWGVSQIADLPVS